MNHPLTPPPELVKQLAAEALTWLDAVTDSYRAGADAELEACCDWLYRRCLILGAEELRAARRPKPPSLVEQALDALNEIEDKMLGPTIQENLIRTALERLKQYEQENNDN